MDLTPLQVDRGVDDVHSHCIKLVKALSAREDVRLECIDISQSEWRQMVFRLWSKIERLWRSRRTTVAAMPDLRHELYPQFFAPQEQQRRRALIEKIRHLADELVFCSDFERRLFVARYDFPTEKSHVVQRGVPDLSTEKADDAALARLGLTGTRYAYYPSDYLPHKNHKLLLMAFAAFCKHQPQFALRLALSGQELTVQAELQQAVQSLGIAENVCFLGPVGDAEKVSLYRNCQFMVYPSLYESFAVPVVEAMQCGSPVLCSDATGMPEIAADAALYFDPRVPGEIEIAMGRILSDEVLRLELRQKGLVRAKRFSVDKMAEQYVAVFQTVLRNRRGDQHGRTGG